MPQASEKAPFDHPCKKAGPAKVSTSLRGAKRRGNPHPLRCKAPPVPQRGTERERIATSGCALLAMTWHFGGFLSTGLLPILRIGRAIRESPLREREIIADSPGCGGYDRVFCGTVITVPYRMVARRGDSRIAHRPSGAGKSPDVKRRKNKRTSHRLPLSLRGADRRRGNPFSFRPPEGDGRCFAPQGVRIATSGFALLAMTW